MKPFEEISGGVAYVLLLIGAFLALHLAPAHADVYPQEEKRWRLEALAGQCQAEPIGEGAWHSQYYPYELHLRSRCYQLSVSEITGQWHGWDTGLRLGYVDLGTMGLNALWWMRDEDFDSRPDGMSCNPTTMQDCLGYGSLRQRVKGFALGGLLERDAMRYLRIGLEGGVFIYEGSFHVRAEPYPHPDTFTGWTGSYSGWQLSPYVGATINAGYLMISARVYTVVRAAEHGCGGCSGPTKGPATQITAGVSIPF
jgi:hypothetical protein